MSKQKTTLVHNVELNADQPTSLTFTQLHEWVIWQFSQQKEDGLSGAVRPPILEAHWYPAIIHPKEKRVQVFGHLNTFYNTQKPQRHNRLWGFLFYKNMPVVIQHLSL